MYKWIVKTITYWLSFFTITVSLVLKILFVPSALKSKNVVIIRENTTD